MLQLEDVVWIIERLFDQPEPHWANTREHTQFYHLGAGADVSPVRPSNAIIVVPVFPPSELALSIGFCDDENIDVESLRARLRKMSDSELLRFGRAARSMCDPKTNLGQPPRHVFVIQLNETRAEWKRRSQK